MANNPPRLQPYIRSPLPTLPGSERMATENELQKLEMSNRSLVEALNNVMQRLAVLESKVP